MSKFNRVTIVGLGLIGGSLGIAIKRRRLAREVIGLSRRSSTLSRAKRCGAIDIGTTDIKCAAQDADLVILATPVDLIVPFGKRFSRHMPPGSILTDVGSSKAQIVAQLDRALPADVAFVGSHPIAGSERRGINAARPKLFDGATCVLTPSNRTKREALRQIIQFWRTLHMHVIVMSALRHDRLLASTSHVPHMLATSLLRAVNLKPLQRAPNSFLEMTRIAKSDPELWDDILLTNREAVMQAINDFNKRWRMLYRLLKKKDRAGIRRQLTLAKRTRDALEDT